MKKLYILICMLFFASSVLLAQNNIDQAQILKLCIEINDLENVLPEKNNNGERELFLLQHPVNFLIEQNQKVGDNIIHLIGIEEFRKNKPETYFIFRSLAQNETQASACYTYIYDSKNPNEKHFKIVLELEKVNQKWTITTKEVKGGSQ